MGHIMTSNRFDELLRDCDADIRSGRASNVRRRLNDFHLARIPKPFRLPLARICRRAGLHTIGLRLLWKTVRGSSIGKPSASELAEYAVLLLRAGAVDEAAVCLQKIDAAHTPEANLFRAYVSFANWSYEASLPYLKDYIAAAPSEYAADVGRANLAFALVELQQSEDAEALLNETISGLSSRGHRQLLANCYALRSQLYLQVGRIDGAQREIELAKSAAGAVASNDGFLITRLNYILKGLEAKSLQPFNEVRELAILNHDWEGLREIDLYSLKVQFDEAKFNYLYFGSPYSGFRNRLLKDAERAIDQDSFLFGDADGRRFELETGRIDGSLSSQAGKKCHQIVTALMRDFYRPLNIGGLFSALFPGEIFDIDSSPDRVHEIIRRARLWSKQENLSFDIVEEKEFYRLKLNGKMAFVVPGGHANIDPMKLQFDRLKTALEPSRPFSALAVRERLGLSKTGAFRLLKWAVESGRVQSRSKNAREHEYTFRESA